MSPPHPDPLPLGEGERSSIQPDFDHSQDSDRAFSGNSEQLRIRIHGDASLPTLIYLPGVHGDWTLVAGLRATLRGKVRFVEFTYPRTLAWTLMDYADAIHGALAENRITSGWLLGESFGSQVLWGVLAQTGLEKFQAEATAPSDFQPQGIILAGGFVCYPYKVLVKIAKLILINFPPWLGQIFCQIYLLYARTRFRKSPETLANVNEFVARRTPGDFAAMVHRLDLIYANDSSDIASRVSAPVFQLSGGIDPVVPMLPVRWWLRKNCSTFSESKTIWLADHNVLGTAPSHSANQVLKWIRASAKPTGVKSE